MINQTLEDKMITNHSCTICMKGDLIDEDIYHSNNLAVNFIVSKGHSKIGYLDSDLSSNYIKLRKKFFINSFI